MIQVITTKGLVDRSLLEVKDIVSDEATCRVTATEWRLDGELVRRDVWVNTLTGVTMGSEQGEVNG